ncbi:MAG: RnfABCDGE type electron transport complex subunit G [Cellulosilyticaceae bacterium]
MKETMKLGGILFCITAVCAGLLGYINSITAPIIEVQKETTKQAAMKSVMPEADTFTQSQEDAENIQEIYIGSQNGQYIGAVAKVMPNGYGGGIELLVGVDKEGQITAVQMLSHAETPGLGANAKNPDFLGQYQNKVAPLTVVKGSASDSEISAITGATITSDAVTTGVNEAAAYIVSKQNELVGGVK